MSSYLYPSPSSLAAGSSGDAHHDQAKAAAAAAAAASSHPSHLLLRQRSSSSSSDDLLNLPDPKRLRSTVATSAVITSHGVSLSLQEWLDSISTSPLNLNSSMSASAHLASDLDVELPHALPDSCSTTSSSSSSLYHSVANSTPVTSPHVGHHHQPQHLCVEAPSVTVPTSRPSLLSARAAAAPVTSNRLDQVSQQGPTTATTKDRFVAGLVGASVLAIESIWGPSSTSSPSSCSAATLPHGGGQVLPLDWFVKEVLRRSRTSCSTLQLALYYLHKARRDVRDLVAKAQHVRLEVARLEAELLAVETEEMVHEGVASYPSPPLSPSVIGPQDLPESRYDGCYAQSRSRQQRRLALQQRLAQLQSLHTSPILCGRRTFLSALISASKFLQDRNYSNRAWARISGLPVGEINANERAFLSLVGWELWLQPGDFRKWTDRLATLTSQPSPTPGNQPPSALDSTTQHSLIVGSLGVGLGLGMGIARSQSLSDAGAPRPAHEVQVDLVRRASLPTTTPSSSSRSGSEKSLPCLVQQPSPPITITDSSSSSSSSSGDDSEFESESDCGRDLDLDFGAGCRTSSAPSSSASASASMSASVSARVRAHVVTSDANVSGRQVRGLPLRRSVPVAGVSRSATKLRSNRA